MSPHDRRTLHRELPADGVRLSYRDHGPSAGPAVVLLHGLSADSSSWAPVVDRFGPGRRCLALDFRGHGRSGHTPGGYRLDDYVQDAARLLAIVGEPAVLVGHSLGAVVAAVLAQRRHPLVAATFLEDPPLYVVEPAVFGPTRFAVTFRVLHEHVSRLQAEGAPVARFRDLLAAAPHPAGDTLGDHLLPDALRSRAAALRGMDPDALAALLDGRTFAGYHADRPLGCPVTVVRADPACEPFFPPADEARLRASSPHVEVVEMAGAGHNIRGDRAARARYLDVLGDFLAAVSPLPGGTRGRCRPSDRLEPVV